MPGMEKIKALAKEGKINEDASITDQHSTVINAPIEKVWDKLTQAHKWVDWNKDITKVESPDTLAEDTSFSWTHNGTKSDCEVQLCKPPNDLSWTSDSVGAKKIYVWSLETDEGQTIVTLKASLQGGLIFLTKSHVKVYNELNNLFHQLCVTCSPQ